MEDAGAAAMVLHSPFEGQIRLESCRHDRITRQGTDIYPETLSHLPDPPEFSLGPKVCLPHLAPAKRTTGLPVIASLNGSPPGGWIRFARQIQEAGADALEVNLWAIPTGPDLTGAELEQRHVDVLGMANQEVSIPVAVKLSPFYTNGANLAARCDAHGANGLVLFYRFFQPAGEPETLGVSSTAPLSVPHELRLSLHWISLPFGRVNCSLAATGGSHNGTDAIKLLLAGADVTMICSALRKHRISHRNCLEPETPERAPCLHAVGVHPQG